MTLYGHSASHVDCPNCGGDGYTVEVAAACCGDYRPDGECCGIAVPEQVQEPCDTCGATGTVARV